MYKINLSYNYDYHTQRNNVLFKNSTCNTTSMVMALLYSKYVLPTPPNTQDEDALEQFLITDSRVSDYYKSIDPIEWRNWQANLNDPKKCIPPNQYHAVLCQGTNLWLNRDDVVTFSTNRHMKDIVWNLSRGSCSVIGGVWCNLGHIVCVVGYISEQDISALTTKDKIDLTKISTIIIDDPYGDYRTNYTSDKGNDIEVPYKVFLANTKNLSREDNKWVHLIEPRSQSELIAGKSGHNII